MSQPETETIAAVRLAFCCDDRCWGAVFRKLFRIRSWVGLAGLAGFWFLEVGLQSFWLLAAGEHLAKSTVLILPAVLVVFFALLAGASYAQARQDQKRAAAVAPQPALLRQDAVRVREELTELGRRRLGGQLGEEEFLVERDEILKLVTRLNRT